ncbi:hypothetical protein VTN77DRAFT_3419 [Rasamsonia byssochlamydoides]|uniref:uncharacterized protein n=1 Tax=Rasamsonia byssochlamydoides TaxID=89139 RepID=UPI0037431D63
MEETPNRLITATSAPCCSCSLPSQRLRRIIIRLRISEATTAITLLSNDRACTQSRVEAAATRRAVRVAGTRASDELLPLTVADQAGVRLRSSSGTGDASWNRLASGLSVRNCCSGSGLRSSSGAFGQRLCCIVIRLGIAKTATTIAFLRNNRAGTKTCIEATAARRAVSIAGTSTSDELLPLTVADQAGVRLRSSSGAGDGSRDFGSGRGSNSSSSRGSSGFSAGSSCQGTSSVVVGLRVAESTASIPFLRNDGTSAETSIKATAA